jgi:hypothetical protein
MHVSMNSIDMYVDEVNGGEETLKKIHNRQTRRHQRGATCNWPLGKDKKGKNDFQLPFEKNCTLGCYCCDVGSSFVL